MTRQSVAELLYACARLGLFTELIQAYGPGPTTGCGFALDLRCVVDLFCQYSMLSKKSTTNRSNGVWIYIIRTNRIKRVAARSSIERRAGAHSACKNAFLFTLLWSTWLFVARAANNQWKRSMHDIALSSATSLLSIDIRRYFCHIASCCRPLLVDHSINLCVCAYRSVLFCVVIFLSFLY